jgi:hypothetical protein
MKKLLVVKDPNMEVGFDALCSYCQAVHNMINDPEVLVLPVWPHGEVALIDDADEVELHIATLREVLDRFEIEKGEDNENGNIKD